MRRSAGRFGDGVLYLDHPAEAETDFVADGVKEVPYDFRNTSGSTYRTKMEKDAAGVLPASCHYHVGACPGWRLPTPRRNRPRICEVSLEPALPWNATSPQVAGAVIHSTQEFLSEDMIQQIASVNGIAGYDATLITLPRIFNGKGEELAHENYSFYNYGSYNSQYHELFLSGRFELVEGTHITDDMTGSITHQPGIG